MSENRKRTASIRTTNFRPVQLALAATAVAGALAGTGITMSQTPPAPVTSSAAAGSNTTHQIARRPVVTSGFGTPDAVSYGS